MKSERGFTMIELLIASMLSVLVLVLIGGMLINSLSSERVVRNATAASNAGQLVAKSVTKGVRNASNINLTEPVPGEQLLMVRTAGASDDAGAFKCQAWYFAPGEVRMKISSTAILAPTPAQLATWTLVGDGIEQVAGAPILTRNPVDGKKIDIKLNAVSGDGAPVLINTSTVSRQPAPTSAEAPICFP